jgi:hypothetical protein
MRLSILFLLVFGLACFAAAAQKMPSHWFSGHISEVKLENQEIFVQRMDAPIAMTFKLAPKIEIYRKGTELSTHDLRAGDLVTVFYEEEGVAIHIEVFPKKTKKKKT